MLGKVGFHSVPAKGGWGADSSWKAQMLDVMQEETRDKRGK